MKPLPLQTSVFTAAKQTLDSRNPTEKCLLAKRLHQDWRSGQLSLAQVDAVCSIDAPGRPSRPELVPPRALPQRRLHTSAGRAALVHAVAHIEFNAINLALDAVYRFRDMPKAYYGDWIQVALEEANHFSLLQQRLSELGYRYGAFDAHDGLWQMAVATAHSPLARMALVPRVMEARGLDVTPGMITRLRAVDDSQTVAVLETILREEVNHVAIGSRWFRYCCEQANLPVEETFLDLLNTHYQNRLRGPFNEPARLAAGFSQTELDRLNKFTGQSIK